MNASSSKHNSVFEDDEIFDDSTFLANFDNTSFRQNKVSENNVNDSLNTSALNVSALCCDEEISGYDKITGQTWIYPTNYPVRDYQFNIINAALVKNTLVSLPTGLGKTFIAAVVMYNFYRWYPLGKIVFTAPTRPLVAQQIDACYNIVAIPPSDTIEMTGHMQVTTRKTHWQTKRVFFATPQVIYNDLKSGICPADKIRCLVVDEAHRARGNYAYCSIVGTLDDLDHKTYRLLALSATPGSKVDDVINVVKSLHIAHLELRTENCIDVAPYSHTRKINTVIIQLGPELTQLRQHYVEIVDGYARRLKQFNILPQNLGNLSKGRIVMLYKEYQNKDRGSRHPQHNYIMKDFTLLIALFHGLELLIKHGSRVFLNFFDEHPEKSWIQADDKLTALLERLRDDLGVNPMSLDRSILPDGTTPEIPNNLCFGHPKFDRLKTIMIEHFTNAKNKGQDTRAIVFCEYRESVNLVHCLLLQCRPLITPQMFVGQGASGKDGKTVVSQKQQLRVMRSFREGLCNALVATCVAEEGLDVGSVDLILCFDISTRSPIRLVQRCGRTGRERGGQVFILVTEGREHQTLMDCMRQRDGLNKKIQQSKEVEHNLYKHNQRMMPHGFTPTCQKMFITVAKKDGDQKKDKSKKVQGQKDLRSMLANRATTSNIPTTVISRKRKTSLNLSDDEEFNVGLVKEPEIVIDDSPPLETKITELVEPVVINSQDTPAIIPAASPAKTKHAKKKQKVLVKSPAKNCGDIRALFSTATKSTKNYTKLINELGVPNDGSVPTRLINLLVDLNLDSSKEKSCYTCQNICDCKTIKLKEEKTDKPVLIQFINEPVLPDLDLIDDMDVETVKLCNKGIECTQDLFGDINKEASEISEKNMDKANSSANFNLEFDFDALDEIGSPDEKGSLDATVILPETEMHECNKPASLISLKEKGSANCSANFDLELDFDALEEIHSPKDNSDNPEERVLDCKKVTGADVNFDLGDIDDIFGNSSPEEVIEKEIVTENAEEESKSQELKERKEEALGFFGLDSIDDIFADSDDSVVMMSPELPKLEANSNPAIVSPKSTNPINNKPKSSIQSIQDNVPNSAYPLSPSILSGKVATARSTSPILCSQANKFQLSAKKAKAASSTPNAIKKSQLPDSSESNVIIIDDDEQKSTLVEKSMFTITQLVDMINKACDKSAESNSKVKSNLSSNEIADILTDDRSPSPILLTQADRKKSITNSSSKSKNQTQNKSLIILDSDSDLDDTVTYDVDEEITKFKASQNKTANSSIFGDKSKFDGGHSKLVSAFEVIDKNETRNSSIVNAKRKFEDEVNEFITASPYFNKKQKLDDTSEKPVTVQQKILAALTTNKNKKISNHQTNFQFTISQPNFSQKENTNPQINTDILNKSSDELKSSPVDYLQKFKKQQKILTLRRKFDTIFKKSPKKSPVKTKVEERSPIKKRIIEDNDDFIGVDYFSPKKPYTYNNQRKATPKKIVFDDSDDDFINDKSRPSSPKGTANKDKQIRSTTNHKVRKKKRKNNSLLDMEAEQSDSNSGDELTDDSEGSIAEFLCDDEVTHQEDILTHYLKSVRSPVRKNGFKIPELPKKYNKADVFSQFVQEDSYEMDSFCVDSHIGLTQVNDVSELELAEMLLKEKRKKKKKRSPSAEQKESPVVKRRNRIVNTLDSDSDSS